MLLFALLLAGPLRSLLSTSPDAKSPRLLEGKHTKMWVLTRSSFPLNREKEPEPLTPHLAVAFL